MVVEILTDRYPGETTWQLVLDKAWKPRDILSDILSVPAGLLTHSLTHLLTYSLTTTKLTYLLTYSLTHSLTYSLTYLLADLVAAAILIPSRLSTGNRKFVGLFGHRPFLCERLGMHEEAKLLKRKLIDM